MVPKSGTPMWGLVSLGQVRATWHSAGGIPSNSGASPGRPVLLKMDKLEGASLHIKPSTACLKSFLRLSDAMKNGNNCHLPAYCMTNRPEHTLDEYRTRA